MIGRMTARVERTRQPARVVLAAATATLGATLVALAPAAHAAGVTRYVSSSMGSDTGDNVCTDVNHPCATMKAAVLASYNDDTDGDTIQFLDAGPYKTYFNGLDDNGSFEGKSWTLVGSTDGNNPTTLIPDYDSNNSYSVLEWGEDGETLAIDHLTLQLGDGGDGIDQHAGTVTVTDSTITGAETTGSNAGIDDQDWGTLTVTDSTITGVGRAGDTNGINYDNGTITITDSTITDNGPTSDPFGSCGDSAHLGDGVSLNNDVALIQLSTISGNACDGVYDEAVSDPDPGTGLTIENSTIAGNGAGGADNGDVGELTLATSDGAKPAPVTVKDSTIDAPAGTTDGELHAVYAGTDGTATPSITLGGDILNAAKTDATACLGTIIDAGYNLASDDSCGFTTDTNGDSTSLNNTDPQLGTLADHGGATETIPPHLNSAAIDAIPNDNGNCLDTDQRGYPRAYPSGGKCDIGAVESAPQIRYVRKDGDDNAVRIDGTDVANYCVDPHHPCLTMKEAVFASSDEGTNGDTIEFGPGTFPTDWHEGGFQVKTWTLDGDTDGGGSVLTSDDATNGSYDVLDWCGECGDSNTLTVDQLTLQIASDGEGIRQGGNGTVTVTNSTITGDGTDQPCYGIDTTGTFVLDHSVVTKTGGTDCPSGVDAVDGTITITDSTISDNGDHGAFEGYGVDLYQEDATIDGTTISGNALGGVEDDGDVEPEGSLRITNSTISGNGAGAGIEGGGDAGELYLAAAKNNPPGPVTVIESTLDAPAGNAEADTAVHALYVDTTASTKEPSVTLAGDILNAAQSACSPDAAASITDNGDNLASDDTCALGEDSLVNPDPKLEALADNGGPTQTMLPGSGSPAIDVISPSSENCLDTDQRGVSRRPSTPGGKCDIGAVEVTQADGGGTPPAKAPSTTTLTASPASGSAVEGQAITLTATVSGGTGDPTGAVAFTADGSSISAACDSAAVSTISSVTTATCTISGGLSAGTHPLVATYGGDDAYTGSSDSIAYSVTSSGGSGSGGSGSGGSGSGGGGGGGGGTSAPALPTVHLTADPATGATPGSPVTLTVTASGSNGTPTGAVTFSIDGVEASCGKVMLTGSNGLATATCQVPAGLTDGTHTLSVSYPGDAEYLAGSATVASYVVTAGGGGVTPPPAGGVVPPTVLTQVHSKHRRHRGWYRNPVTIRFICQAGSSPLAQPCPAPFHFRHNGINQSVTVTVSGTDGGTTTVGDSGINIDKTKPQLRILGARNRHHYRHTRVVRIKAHDAYSGLAWSHLRLRHTYRHNRHGHRVEVFHVKAVARDQAGNYKRRHLKYYVRA